MCRHREPRRLGKLATVSTFHFYLFPWIMLCMVMGGCDAMGPWALTLIQMVTISTQNRYHSDVANLSSQAQCNAHSAFGDIHPIHPTWRCVIIWRNASQTRYNWMEPVLETVTRILCNWCPAPDQNIKTSKQNKLHYSIFPFWRKLIAIFAIHWNRTVA